MILVVKRKKFIVLNSQSMTLFLEDISSKEKPFIRFADLRNLPSWGA